jgi:hypothetical protein
VPARIQVVDRRRIEQLDPELLDEGQVLGVPALERSERQEGDVVAGLAQRLGEVDPLPLRAARGQPVGAEHDRVAPIQTEGRAITRLEQLGDPTGNRRP